MKRKRWNKEENDKAINLLKSGKNFKYIAEELGRTAKAISVMLNKNGYSYLEEQKEIKKCINCGKEFLTTVSNVKKFCNSSCSASFNNKKRSLDYKKTKDAFCVVCGIGIIIKIRASDKLCKCDNCISDKELNRKTAYSKKNSKYRNLKKGDKCINCGKQLKSKETFFCNNSCVAEFNRKEIYKRIECGENLGAKWAKLYLIEKCGEKCMECGWNKINKFSNKIPIELEHIDGNSENNNLENLKLLCPSCHSLTPTYKYLNAGNGRYKRKQRYADGKSF